MSLAAPGCKEEPPLRVNGRRVHLTYAGLYRDELDHDTILSKARHWGATRNLRGRGTGATAPLTHLRPPTWRGLRVRR